MKSKTLRYLAWGIGSFIVSIFYFWGLNYLGQQRQNSSADPEELLKKELHSGWFFSPEDISNGADPSLNDSAWRKVRSDSLPADYSGKPAWFRYHLEPGTETSAQPLAMIIDHFGASEIYLDGVKLASYGKVAADPQTEELFQPKSIPLPVALNPNKSHLLAIRYSFAGTGKVSIPTHTHVPGFEIAITTQDQALRTHSSVRAAISGNIGVASFLLTLALIHFLLYLFYRKASENLYFSLFAISYAGIFFLATLSNHSTSPVIVARSEQLLTLLANPVLFFTLLIFVYKVYDSGFPRIAWLAVASSLISLGYVLFGWFGTGVYSMCAVWLAVFTVITMILGTYRALREKKPGARILGASIVIFALFIFFLLSLLFYSTGNGFHITLNDPLFLVAILALMLCLPISMSVYLAYTFSVTNRSLQKKLLEVETLSARSIEQEKEKQKILEGQKEMLETQVRERTAEISEQKKVIEEKNKDITDSINYAKRIQDSILPGTDLIRRIFPDSFVLFKPKDIVSGDFYWFGEVDGWKIAVCADCTGHGVPGALMSMIGSNLLHQAIMEKRITSPELILKDLQYNLLVTLKQLDGTICAPTRVQDGMDLGILCINAEQHTGCFAGAQRQLWLIRDGEFTEWKGDKIPVSATGNADVKFTRHDFPLKDNDLFVLSSDGYADQFGGNSSRPGGKKMMTKEFKSRLVLHSKKDILGIEVALDQEFEKWRGDLEQMDDVCVIGIKIQG